MSKSESISYQMFETYYRKATEAERAEKPAEAKKMYLMASQSMLKAAQESSGEMKKAMVQKADKLQRIADAISVMPKAMPPKKQQRESRDLKDSDESLTVWKRAEKPKTRFDDIAGLKEVKESIQKRIILPRLHPELYKTFRREVNGGILLYGPPGTGKTMMAKAIASEIDADFFSVCCSDIVGKYFGDSEKNVKGLFESARSCESAVIFFDEFEALGTHRGGHSTVMNRLVPELLSQMDGFSGKLSEKILVLAATNRPWDIDSAFMRPPRLTEKIYVGLPDYEARRYLIQKAFQDVPCGQEVSIERIAKLTEDYNAADLIALCGSIKDQAILRCIESGNISCVLEEDINEGLRKIKSSVQKKDIEQIRRWEQIYQQ